MKCPRCPDELRPVGTQGQAHACPRGHGHLLSPDEVARAFAKPDADALLRAHLGSATPGDPCAACGEPTRQVRTSEPSEHRLDACPACRAIWFDGDAAERLAAGGIRVKLSFPAPLQNLFRSLP